MSCLITIRWATSSRVVSGGMVVTSRVITSATVSPSSRVSSSLAGSRAATALCPQRLQNHQEESTPVVGITLSDVGANPLGRSILLDRSADQTYTRN